jgi:hypothetical protein
MFGVDSTTLQSPFKTAIRYNWSLYLFCFGTLEIRSVLGKQTVAGLSEKTYFWKVWLRPPESRKYLGVRFLSILELWLQSALSQQRS